MDRGAIPEESPRNLPEQLLLQDAKASVGKRIQGSADKPLGDAARLVANYGGIMEAKLAIGLKWLALKSQ